MFQLTSQAQASLGLEGNGGAQCPPRCLQPKLPRTEPLMSWLGALREKCSGLLQFPGVSGRHAALRNLMVQVGMEGRDLLLKLVPWFVLPAWTW